MTTNYHTAISVGAAANAATFNAPLAQLDAVLDGLLGDATNALKITRTENIEAVLVNGNLSGAGLFSHAYADNTVFTSTGTGAYASFDARPEMVGEIAYNHYYGFEARNIFTPTGAGSCDTMVGFYNGHTVNGPVKNDYGIRLVNPAGSGVIDYNMGIYIEDLTRGTANYAIYSAGTAPSYHGGNWQTGGDVICGGNVTADNFRSSAMTNTVMVGNGISTNDVYYGAVLGYNAGHSLTSDGQYNTLVGGEACYSTTTGDNITAVGYKAGYTNTTANGSVFIGYKAGYYETAGSKLFVDNAQRSSEADGRAKALVYGVFDADIANQLVTINGRLGLTTAPAAQLHVDQPSTTGAIPVLTLDQADVSEPFIKLIGESTTDNTQSLIDAADLEDIGAIVGWFKVYVEDVQGTNPITDGVYWVPFYATPTHSA